MGRKKSYNRGEVLDQSMKLFWEKGYEGAHLQELVKVTGLNRFGLYKEFGSKQGLLKEALEKYLGDMEFLGNILKQEPKGLDNLQQYFDATINYPFYHGCFAVNLLTQHPVLSDESRDKLFQFFSDGEQLLFDNLRAAKEAGDINAEIDIELLAKFTAIFDIGLVVFDIFKPDMRDKQKLMALLKKLITN
jgi:TetR/AcrR family transcriptional repressor of nem operon